MPPLEELERDFRGDPQEVTIAYAAARDLANHLRYRDADGSDLRQLFTELRQGHGFDAAVVRSYGVTLGDLEVEWRTGLRGRFSWFPMGGSGELPFFLVMPLVTYAYFRRRIQLKAAWDRLDREEREFEAHLARRYSRLVSAGQAATCRCT